ncbi:MAG: hypothetical protein KAS07_05565 [Candidatus Pacebacteria bacterium]|nr:hypothetical protein [Candidatus Paceibacterota bacterium]
MNVELEEVKDVEMDGIDFAEKVKKIYNYYKKDGGSFTPTYLTDEMLKIAKKFIEKNEDENG